VGPLRPHPSSSSPRPTSEWCKWLMSPSRPGEVAGCLGLRTQTLCGGAQDLWEVSREGRGMGSWTAGGEDAAVEVENGRAPAAG
jgi:hypothetical protein